MQHLRSGFRTGFDGEYNKRRLRIIFYTLPIHKNIFLHQNPCSHCDKQWKGQLHPVEEALVS